MTAIKHRIGWVAILLAIFSFGCTKYEQDGALIQFRKPEKRILGTWNSSSVTEVGTDADTNVTEFLTSNNLRLQAMFEGDGSVTFENVGEELFYEGTWAFNEDNSVLHLDLECLKPTGPFFLDTDSIDRSMEMMDALTKLQSSDPLFFEAGTFQDITEEVMNCVNLLSTTGFVWLLENGNGTDGSISIDGITYYPGDVITAWVQEIIEDSIDDWVDDGSVADDQDFDGIVQAVMNDYNVAVSYFNQETPLIEGLDDPNVIAAVFDNCGYAIDAYNGSPSDVTDADVLAYVNANSDFSVLVSYSEVLRLMDVYWQILELEQDDLQAYQFREYVEDVSVFDYSFLLRFEKE